VHHLVDSSLLNCVPMPELRPYSALFVAGWQEDGTAKCDVASSNCRHMYAGTPQRKNLNDLRSILVVVSALFFNTALLFLTNCLNLRFLMSHASGAKISMNCVDLHTTQITVVTG